MKKIIMIFSILLTAMVLVGFRTDVVATATEVQFKPIQGDVARVKKKLNRAQKNHKGKPWTIKLKGLKESKVGKVDAAIDKMRVFGEFWATYYNYYKNAQDEEVYDLTIVNCSYTVKDGDTWKSIADKYNVKVKRLKKMNPLYSPWKLRPNMKVTVKIPPQYTFKDIYSFS